MVAEPNWCGSLVVIQIASVFDSRRSPKYCNQCPMDKDMSKLVVGSIEGTAYSGVRIPAYARTVEKSDWSKSVASPPSPAMRYRIMALRSVLVRKSGVRFSLPLPS